MSSINRLNISPMVPASRTIISIPINNVISINFAIPINIYPIVKSTRKIALSTTIFIFKDYICSISLKIIVPRNCTVSTMTEASIVRTFISTPMITIRRVRFVLIKSSII